MTGRRVIYTKPANLFQDIGQKVFPYDNDMEPLLGQCSVSALDKVDEATLGLMGEKVQCKENAVYVF